MADSSQIGHPARYHPVLSSSRQRIQRIWRRGRDSNPRYGFPYSSFQDWRLQPLGHLSVGTLSQISLFYGRNRVGGFASLYKLSRRHETTSSRLDTPKSCWLRPSSAAPWLSKSPSSGCDP